MRSLYWIQRFLLCLCPVWAQPSLNSTGHHPLAFIPEGTNPCLYFPISLLEPLWISESPLSFSFYKRTFFSLLRLFSLTRVHTESFQSTILPTSPRSLEFNCLSSFFIPSLHNAPHKSTVQFHLQRQFFKIRKVSEAGHGGACL